MSHGEEEIEGVVLDRVLLPRERVAHERLPVVPSRVEEHGEKVEGQSNEEGARQMSGAERQGNAPGGCSKRRKKRADSLSLRVWVAVWSARLTESEQVPESVNKFARPVGAAIGVQVAGHFERHRRPGDAAERAERHRRSPNV